MIGRALSKFPIQLHAFEGNINHPHVKFSATEAQLDNVVPFFQGAFSTIARNINRLRKRKGDVFGGKARIHLCLDEAAAEQKLLYAMTNTVKDNLIERTNRSPFFSTYRHQAHGKPLRYWYIDYDAYWAAGGNRKSKHRLKDYLRWVEWKTTPLPHHQKMTNLNGKRG